MKLFKKKSKYSINELDDQFLVEVRQTTNSGFYEFEEKFPCDKDGSWIPVFDYIDWCYGKKDVFSPAIFDTKKEAEEFIKLNDSK